jgi:hypothetical protein
MKAFVSALVCIIPLTAFATEEDAIMQKAVRIITQHRLLSRAELTCSSLVLEEATKMAATVTVREKHGGKCGGAPETAPRRFTMEIDLKTGAAKWDNNYPGWKADIHQFRSASWSTPNRDPQDGFKHHSGAGSGPTMAYPSD